MYIAESVCKKMQNEGRRSLTVNMNQLESKYMNLLV